MGIFAGIVSFGVLKTEIFPSCNFLVLSCNLNKKYNGILVSEDILL
jgi:hypothetical protein